MNKLKVFLTVALTLVVSVSMAFALTMSVDELKQLTSSEPVEQSLGAFPGGDIYNRVNLHAGYQSGGELFATTSSAATFTMLPANWDGDVTTVEWKPNVSTTLTTWGTSTMYNIIGNNIGDTRSYMLYNASTTAAATITLAAGTGVDLQEDEGETVVINGLEYARLTFIRKTYNTTSNTNVALIVEVFQVGD